LWRSIDKHLPAECSVPVYSGAQGDEPPVSDYLLSEDEEKKVRKEFAAKGTQPKILIVTEKLLTGYDAPILYCMYLDKPMRDHVLLQAIARVNRPYEDEDGLVKPHGYVLDFVGIFENVKKAMSFDADVVASVIQNIDVLKDRFEMLMKGPARQYLGHAILTTDKDIEKAVERYQDQQARKEFFSFFRQVEDLYEILSPDPCLRPFIDDFQKLAELYALIRGADRMYVDRELTNKTRELLRQRTTGGTPTLPNAIRELGAEQLAALRNSGSSDTVKVLNLKKAIQQAVEEQQASKPYLVSIGERAEKLAQAYQDRQVSTQQLLLDFENLAQQYIDADAERQRLDVDENTFAIYNVVKLVTMGVTKDQAVTINTLFERHPDYQWHEQQKSKLRAELYKALRPVVGAGKMIEVASTLLRLQRV
jgi:type I restriction enzyme R subunit